MKGYQIHTLGLVAKNIRRIFPGTLYDKFFPRALRVEKILKQDGDVHDTVELIKQIVLETLEDTRKIAPLLRRPTLRATTQAIFDFVYNHYQYREDQPGIEQLRRPRRAWHDRASGIDCDCMAITISSILTNLKIPHTFRIVKMHGKEYYQHIYVIVPLRPHRVR